MIPEWKITKNIGSHLVFLLCYFQMKHSYLKNIPKDTDDKALNTFHAEQLFFSGVWSQSQVSESENV